MTVIDVHTHMLTRDYVDLLAKSGAPLYQMRVNRYGEEIIERDGVPFFTLAEPMWDYERRIQDMDSAGVDLAVVSLTCPNAYFGDQTTSSKAARIVNESMAEQQRLRPDRIAWLASLPWQYPEAAVQELDHALAAGAVGVMVIANIAGDSLTDPKFEPVWSEIDRRGLPVLVHPGVPLPSAELGLDEFGLAPAVGFTFDTSLAFARICLSGFLDRFSRLKLIAAHGGGALPYLASRLDRCYEQIPAARAQTATRPSEFLQRIYYDAVVYSREALELCIDVAGSPDRVLFGSDYPHNIGDMQGCLQRVDSLPATAAAKIRGRNAQQLFGF